MILIFVQEKYVNLYGKSEVRSALKYQRQNDEEITITGWVIQWYVMNLFLSSTDKEDISERMHKMQSPLGGGTERLG